MNDLRVVTLQSVPGASEKIQGTRLKVWDSVTGDLLRMIRTVSTGTVSHTSSPFTQATHSPKTPSNHTLASTAVSSQPPFISSIPVSSLSHFPAVSTGVGSVLEPHPLDPSIVITGGEDGIVSVWDIENEERLYVYQFEGPENLKIWDASFSPDGSRFSVTTSKGGWVKSLALDRYFLVVPLRAIVIL